MALTLAAERSTRRTLFILLTDVTVIEAARRNSQIVSRTRNPHRVLTHRTSAKNPCRLYAFFLEIPQRADIHVDKPSYVM
jgi:hypothetical protein